MRDVYDLGDRLLVVATDRLSAFDVVLPTGIPGKGVVLTQLSLFWFRLLADVAPQPRDHRRRRASTRPSSAPSATSSRAAPCWWSRRIHFPSSASCAATSRAPAWKDYQATGSVCGIPLPAGLRESDRLERPIFTPATKAESGHDENIPFAEMERRVGAGRAAGGP